MELHKNVKIHFVGVGGVSMSALAKYALSQGAEVSGSDREYSQVLKELQSMCKVYVGENPSVVDGVDLVIYSSAIGDEHPELGRARELHIPTLERREFLGMVGDSFQTTVGIAGTHGKTTVTALITHGLKKNGASFSAHIGGETEFGNLILEGNKIFVTEACEYKKSLLSLNPKISIVLNAECDHPDCYKDVNSLLKVYLKFLEKAEIKIFSTEFLDVCSNSHMFIGEYEKLIDNPKIEKLQGRHGDRNQKSVIVLSNGTVEIFTYKNMGNLSEEKYSHIEIYRDDKFLSSIKAPNWVVNHENILFAYAVMCVLGYDDPTSFDGFKGVKRRNEYVGKLSGANVVFDYAHHPTQINNLLSLYKGRNLVIFQPHTYSRTLAYIDDFASALSRADTVVIMETYGARESVNDGVDSEGLVKHISTKFAKTKLEHIKTHQSTLEYVVNTQKNFDNILFLGAGNIYSIKDDLAKYLDKKLP